MTHQSTSRILNVPATNRTDVQYLTKTHVSTHSLSAFLIALLLALSTLTNAAQAQFYDTLWLKEFDSGFFGGLQFFPSGNSLVAVGFGSGGDSVKSHILNPNDGSIRSSFRADSRLYFLNNSDDTAVIMRRGNPYIVHLPTMSILDSLQDDGLYSGGYSAALSNNGKFFFASDNIWDSFVLHKNLTCWDMNTKRIVSTMPPIVYNPIIDSNSSYKLSNWGYSFVAPLPDGESFYMVLSKTFTHWFYPQKKYNQTWLIRYATNTMLPLDTLQNVFGGSEFLSFRISRDGRYLAMSAVVGPKGIIIYDRQEKKVIVELDNLGGQIPDFAFSPDSKYLALANSNGGASSEIKTTVLYDVQTGLEVKYLTKRTSAMNVCFSPDGKFLASNVAEGIAMWNLAGILSVNDAQNNSDLLYPNPADHSITVNLTTPQRIMSIGVFDMMGNLVKRSAVTNEPVASISLDISGLSSGRYTVMLTTVSGSASYPFIIQ